jgi:hypothetical protein
MAQRDLAYLLAREGNVAAAKEAAEAARSTLDRLGAKAEAEKLDALLRVPAIEPAADVGYDPQPTSLPKSAPLDARPGA